MVLIQLWSARHVTCKAVPVLALPYFDGTYSLHQGYHLKQGEALEADRGRFQLQHGSVLR